MVSISLLNNHIFVFIAVVIISLVIISTYNMIAPEHSTPFNFDPFPKETPSKLPDPSRQTDTCWNKLTMCDSSGECSACSSGEYKCTTISKDEADRKFYHYNGINVPAGKWCLPKDNNPNPICNSFTGRWLWTFDPEYCASVGSGGQQCWKCECLYPSLFSGANEGCNTSLACQNDSLLTKSASIGQPDNKLTGSGVAKLSVQNCTWDPTKQTKDDKCGDVYNYTPYDKDKDGNPWFTCSCKDTKSGQYFTKLPGDPQTCHLESCYKYLGNTVPGLTCSGHSCSCNCDNTNFAKSPGGKFADTCVLISNSCGHFGWDDDRKECSCGNGPSWPRKCKNSTTGVNMDEKELPDCVLPENALGSECFNPCEASVCNHGAPCISCGPDSVKSGVEQCRMDSDNGTMLSDPTKIHAICDCSVGDSPPARPDGKPTHFGGYYGPSCSTLCLQDGTKIEEHGVLGSGDGSQSCACCCSLRSKVEQDLWVLYVSERCDGSRPTPDKPADPVCLPIPKIQCGDQESK